MNIEFAINQEFREKYPLAEYSEWHLVIDGNQLDMAETERILLGYLFELARQDVERAWPDAPNLVKHYLVVRDPLIEKQVKAVLNSYLSGTSSWTARKPADLIRRLIRGNPFNCMVWPRIKVEELASYIERIQA